MFSNLGYMYFLHVVFRLFTHLFPDIKRPICICYRILPNQVADVRGQTVLFATTATSQVHFRLCVGIPTVPADLFWLIIGRLIKVVLHCQRSRPCILYLKIVDRDALFFLSFRYVVKLYVFCGSFSLSVVFCIYLIPRAQKNSSVKVPDLNIEL